MTRSPQTLSRTVTAEAPKGIIGFYFTGWFRGTEDELPRKWRYFYYTDVKLAMEGWSAVSTEFDVQ